MLKNSILHWINITSEHCDSRVYLPLKINKPRKGIVNHKRLNQEKQNFYVARRSQNFELKQYYSHKDLSSLTHQINNCTKGPLISGQKLLLEMFTRWLLRIYVTTEDRTRGS